VIEEIDRPLGEGKHIAVTVAEEQERLSPQHAADQLGFSRQHIVRLINASELEAQKAPRIQLLTDPAQNGTRVRGAPRTRSRAIRRILAIARRTGRPA
jgi:hypothetical protein